MARNMMFKISGNSVKSTYVGSPCSSEEEHPLTTALQVTHSRQFHWIPWVPCRLQRYIQVGRDYFTPGEHGNVQV